MINKYNDYFYYSEFDSPDQPESGFLMSNKFLSKLSRARHHANIPFIIKSGFRTVEHNKTVGGVSKSSHLVGLACDIYTQNSKSRFIILTALLKVGFNRIGIGQNFIHVDDSQIKTPNVLWLY